jgi:hypothetical protein
MAKKSIMFLTKEYTTHMALLFKVLLISKGDVIECGGGIFSTPFLHWICKVQNRKLITYENESEYYEFERKFKSPGHKVIFVENWDDIPIPKKVGMVFIDHHPSERRMIELRRFKDVADYVVIHDTQRLSREYNKQEVFDLYKYRHDWKECSPWTSVVSNFNDLSNI